MKINDFLKSSAFEIIFHTVPEYIAIFFFLWSCKEADFTICISQRDICSHLGWMIKSGRGYRTDETKRSIVRKFFKEMIKHGVFEIVEKGSVDTNSTVYRFCETGRVADWYVGKKVTQVGVKTLPRSYPGSTPEDINVSGDWYKRNLPSKICKVYPPYKESKKKERKMREPNLHFQNLLQQRWKAGGRLPIPDLLTYLDQLTDLDHFDQEIVMTQMQVNVAMVQSTIVPALKHFGLEELWRITVEELHPIQQKRGFGLLCTRLPQMMKEDQSKNKQGELPIEAEAPEKPKKQVGMRKI